MIVCHLAKRLKEKNRTAEQLHKDTRVPKATIRELLAQDANHIDFDELEALCDYLQCQVGDLLEHSDTKPEAE